MGLNGSLLDILKGIENFQEAYTLHDCELCMQTLSNFLGTD